MRNQVQLIAYADRLAGTIEGLHELLDAKFAGAFGGVHVLPFYPPYDGADAGFDPVDHTQVDPRLGTWADIKSLAGTYDVMADLIVNHVSADSARFQDVVVNGRKSAYAPMFLTMSAVFPDGATEADLTTIYRPRPGLPFTPLKLGEELRYVWTTFSPEQIDIDISSDLGRDYLSSILDAVAAAGVGFVRLDAVGYAVKTPGTSCFMTPETFDFIDAFTRQAQERGVEVLVEVHSYYQDQVAIAAKVDYVYDFALPPLLLHALYTGDGTALLGWLRERPVNAVTVLDTHDGIGIIDAGPRRGERPGDPLRPGLLDEQQIATLVSGLHERTRGSSEAASGATASNLDLYQINSTYYDALGRDDARYLAARAIQFFAPGIPQVYYVGALAGHNDMQLLGRTNVGRDINRHYYTPEEIDAALQRPVVRALLQLCRLRNTIGAFETADAALRVELAGSVLIMQRGGSQGPWARLRVDLATGAAALQWVDADGVTGRLEDLLTLLD